MLFLYLFYRRNVFLSPSLPLRHAYTYTYNVGLYVFPNSRNGSVFFCQLLSILPQGISAFRLEKLKIKQQPIYLLSHRHFKITDKSDNYLQMVGCYMCFIFKCRSHLSMRQMAVVCEINFAEVRLKM